MSSNKLTTDSATAYTALFAFVSQKNQEFYSWFVTVIVHITTSM